MKIKLLILINITTCLILFGQMSNNIKIYYEGTINVNKKNVLKNTQGNSEATRMIIDEMSKTKEYLLIGNRFESIFEEIQKIDNEQKNNDVRFGNNKGLQIFINNKDSVLYEQVNLHRLFLVKNKLKPIKWILDRKYSNKNRKKAYYLDPINKMNIIAYYSTELNYKIGPDRFWGLPGAILELQLEYLDENSLIESFIFKAKKIEEDLKYSLKIPKGKIITKEEYDEIIEKIKFGNQTTEEIK